MDFTEKANNLFGLASKVGYVYTRRMVAAQENLCDAIRKAVERLTAGPAGPPGDGGPAWSAYVTDSVQRSILFWDTIRQRGDGWLEHEREGKPPVLVFDYEIVVDARTFEVPVNYALVRIIPPAGTVIDDKKRPFIVIDPRAGHGPGIGGFKQDSEIGVALKAGHPVYAVIFFPRPEPGQTLPDVCAAQARFVEAVRARHPQSPKPAVVGNCQGGWATMLVAASRPDVTGPVVINGAPMSYWSGNWQGGDAENPMRYVGGLLGGAWPARFAADAGNGLVDGAHLVANFENLNPANTLWTKYYHLYANVDTEPPRFLEFEKWWGGYSLLNEAEMCWIVDNLFVGNRLARGEVKAGPRGFFDLKAIKSPIIVFSSGGDNITPPQQAMNWIADVYTSTEEIKTHGQVIVGLFHADVGHLGIFVSGRVAKKEHAQIVQVLEYVEHLRPGLYLMSIREDRGPDGKPVYDVSFEEKRLEDLRKINRLQRKDEKPFEAVAAVSEMYERAYTFFVRPFVRPFVTDVTAELGRAFHPLRMQRWAFSDLNPWMWPLAALAPAVRAARQAAGDDNVFRKVERAASDTMVAALDYCRDARDAACEALFFQTYGSLTAVGAVETTTTEALPAADPRDLPAVRQALAAIGRGGYPEAVALIGALLGRAAGDIPLARLAVTDRLIRTDEVLSRLSPEEARRLKSEQAVVAELEPDRGLRSLPRLLSDPVDRGRVLELLDEVVSDFEPTPEQKQTLERIRGVLGTGPRRRPAPAGAGAAK